MAAKVKCSPVVEAIGQIDFEGNIIPHVWFRHPLLCFKNGRPNLNAIVILADVIYWYRPSYELDKATGQTVSKQKFQKGMLQMSYKVWAEKFNLTRRQVQSAVGFLKRKGILRVEHCTIKTDSGKRLGNVTFVEPIAKKILQITTLADPPTTESDSPPTSERTRVIHPNVQGSYVETSDIYGEYSTESFIRREKGGAASPPAFSSSNNGKRKKASKGNGSYESDIVFEALIEIQDLNGSPITDSVRGRANRFGGQLRRIHKGRTDEELVLAIKGFPGWFYDESTSDGRWRIQEGKRIHPASMENLWPEYCQFIGLTSKPSEDHDGDG